MKTIVTVQQGGGMSLKNHVVLVTGASRGIGRAIAKRFAEDGAMVAVCARTPEGYKRVVTEITNAGGVASGFLLDVSNDQQVVDAVRQVIETWGKIDILVNCAGIILYDTPTWTTTVEQWDEMMAVNLRGTFLTCRAVAPHMVERRAGAIVNIGSSSARAADDDSGPYTASKWAVVGYTSSLARSLRPYGIRVNGMNPGWVDSDMSRAFKPEGDSEWSTVEEIAAVALFLAAQSPRDMTGQFVDIFGSQPGP
jgi:3-oxoacyl-[acyl-carrier protein] reductase